MLLTKEFATNISLPEVVNVASDIVYPLSTLPINVLVAVVVVIPNSTIDSVL